MRAEGLRLTLPALTEQWQRQRAMRLLRETLDEMCEVDGR